MAARPPPPKDTIITNERMNEEMTNRILTCLFLMLALAAALAAHGDAIHVTGTVKAISPASVTVETVKHESVTVVLGPKTEVMKSAAKADIKDLKVGDRVVIHAMKNKEGQLEAEEVAFGATPAASQHADHQH
jgi:Cu/Ag efflux protein CusF